MILQNLLNIICTCIEGRQKENGMANKFGIQGLCELINSDEMNFESFVSLLTYS